MNKNSALLLIDLQQDFCLNGSLEVPDADAIIPVANHIQRFFPEIIATKDWHPKQHISFSSTHGKTPGEVITDQNNLAQILWPDHCVQNTPGAEFHEELSTNKINKIVYKGQNKLIDSYSAFFDNAKLSQTDLAEYLHQHSITELYLGGLAIEYCVKYSCYDALSLGFRVNLIIDCCRGIAEDSVKQTIEELLNLGVSIVESKNL